MRVPIENGLGFHQPGYQILLSSLQLTGTSFNELFKIYFISKLPEAVSSSPQKTRYT
jgi:hypothetical protein